MHFIIDIGLNLCIKYKILCLIGGDGGDNSGNGPDVSPPVISGCPADIEISAPTGSSSSVATWTNPTARDNSGVTPVRTATHESGDIFSAGTTPVVITFTDAAGNSATCSFNVLVSGSSSGKLLQTKF